MSSDPTLTMASVGSTLLSPPPSPEMALPLAGLWEENAFPQGLPALKILSETPALIVRTTYLTRCGVTDPICIASYWAPWASYFMSLFLGFHG